jgi:hypothetical protein
MFMVLNFDLCITRGVIVDAIGWRSAAMQVRRFRRPAMAGFGFWRMTANLP